MRGKNGSKHHACAGQENTLYSKCGLQGLWEGFAFLRAVDGILCVVETAQNTTHARRREGGEGLYLVLQLDGDVDFGVGFSVVVQADA